MIQNIPSIFCPHKTATGTHMSTMLHTVNSLAFIPDKPRLRDETISTELARVVKNHYTISTI